jgi:hypothetical protein
MRATYVFVQLVLGALASTTLLGCGDDSSSTGGSGATSAGGEGGAGATGAGASGAGASGAGGEGGVPTAGGAGGTTSDGGGPPNPCEGAPTVSFATDVLPILVESCSFSSCHAGAQPDAGLDLTEGNAYAELVNISTSQCNGSRVRVVPGDAAESYLVDKLRGVDMCGTGQKMPRTYPPGSNAAPWTPEKTSIVEAWVCGGALDD